MSSKKKNELIKHIPQPEYDRILSLIPIVCVDVAIIYAGKILFIKRRDEPAAGEWWLPGGRLYRGEALIDCAYRKAKEEVGLDCKSARLVHYEATNFGSIHSVNFCYLLEAKGDDVKLDDTCLDYQWVMLNLSPIGTYGTATDWQCLDYQWVMLNLSGRYHSYIVNCLRGIIWLA
jgi:colanic acid biosynthesis protein WcaH